MDMEIESDKYTAQKDVCNTPSAEFNVIIGYIEDIVISADFQVRHVRSISTLSYSYIF